MSYGSTIKLIDCANLSEAWARAFLTCWKTPGVVLAPGVISFNADEEDEDWSIETPAIRRSLERLLAGFSDCSVRNCIETIAGTIFPQSIWLRCGGDRHKLYSEYDMIWPRVKRCFPNRYGVYFRRLTAFEGHGKAVNQLETIITTWHKGVHRHSALQAGVFDPLRDHKATRQLGFPCLQQVVFRPNGVNGTDGLSVVAFYATQLLLEKAYGNYLGLHRLGRFMAGEMGLALRDVTCVASDLKLTELKGVGKGTCKPLADALQKELGDAE